MRGKGRAAGLDDLRHRITPAYAGKSHHSRTESVAPRDHPRVCGEKYRAGRCGHPGRGSPPRMRGKALPLVKSILSDGITPAYAGKRGGLPFMRRIRRDHPRVCGEKSAPITANPSVLGSPPRMRGKERRTPAATTRPRITPAYAGKRMFWLAPMPARGDHPRVCGEKTKKIP